MNKLIIGLADKTAELTLIHDFKIEIEEAPERNVHGFKGYRLKQAQLVML
jgi:hypothetical protein